MQWSRFLRLAGLAAILLGAGLAASSIQVENPARAPKGGDGEFAITLRLATDLQDVGGLQGVLYYNPSRLTGVTLDLGPAQPPSMVMRFHETTPGEIRFFAYSIQDVFDHAHPVLLCQLAAKYPEDAQDLASVVAVDLVFLAGPGGELREDYDRYTNIPIRAAPGAAESSPWILY